MFLDANIFIHAYRNPERKGSACRETLERIKKGEHAATSPLVIDEVVYVLDEQTGPERALKAAQNILRIDNLRILDINRLTCEYAIGYMERGLDPHDAFHAALMKQNGIQTICSYDRDFDKIKEIKRKEP